MMRCVRSVSPDFWVRAPALATCEYDDTVTLTRTFLRRLSSGRWRLGIRIWTTFTPPGLMRTRRLPRRRRRFFLCLAWRTGLVSTVIVPAQAWVAVAGQETGTGATPREVTWTGPGATTCGAWICAVGSGARPSRSVASSGGPPAAAMASRKAPQAGLGEKSRLSIPNWSSRPLGFEPLLRRL